MEKCLKAHMSIQRKKMEVNRRRRRRRRTRKEQATNRHGTRFMVNFTYK